MYKICILDKPHRYILYLLYLHKYESLYLEMFVVMIPMANI